MADTTGTNGSVSTAGATSTSGTSDHNTAGIAGSYYSSSLATTDTLVS